MSEPGQKQLRTVLCTCGGLYGALVLRRLRACDRLNIVAIVRSTRVLDPHVGFLRGALAHVRRSGLAYALYLWYSTALAEWLCAVAGAERVPTHGSSPGVRVYATRDLNNADGLRFLASCAPDLLVSAFFNQRLHPAALAVPKRGCLNIHPSLLPAARGVDPVFQALLRGSPPLGVTVHFMAPELDAGPIVAQRACGPRAASSVFSATALLFREGADLLAASIEAIANGAAGTPQNSAGSYESWPTRAEVGALRSAGGRLVRFSDLARLLRGWPLTDTGA
ncbi:MAG TPA: formyltransferase family protein [Steroidobacteraceae bacterium]|nr:formyltransferase family protein [Steroidobacteraceae bacterium]